MKKLLLMIVAMFMAIAVSAQTNKKVIYLKNGTVVRGVVIDQVPGESIKVRTADGSVFMYTMAEIKMIEREEIIDPKMEKKKSGLKKGWHSFFDTFIGYGKGTRNASEGDYEEKHIGFGCSYTLGYSISSFFYTGIGVGYENYYDEDLGYLFPAFVDLKYFLFNKRQTPFLDLKTGVNMSSKKIYICPSIGYRFRISKSNGINLSLSYIYAGLDDNHDHDCPDVSAVKFNIGFDF